MTTSVILKLFRPAGYLSNFKVKRYSTTTSQTQFSVRCASEREVKDFVTREVIKEGWHVGPYDFSNAFAFDPKGFIVGEIDKKLAGHVNVMRYPNHSSFVGAHIVTDGHRGEGYGKKLIFECYKVCDKSCTIGGDMDLRVQPWFEAKFGAQCFWDTYVAMLRQDKIVQNLNGFQLPYRVTIKPIKLVSLSSLLEYDSFVFGTQRHAFIKRWISTPGSFGYVAVKENSIVGYTILRQVIRGDRLEIGLGMAPLYADNVHIAKALLKTAAEKCLANEATPNATFELVHPVEKGCGEGSSELMEELEAELTHVAVRLYSKGLPPGRKLGKIYGIASPSFD